MPELTLYYSPFCGYCGKVLRFMEDNNIEVALKNTIEKPENRQELLDIGGKAQTPCLVIDGKALYESDDIIQWFKDNWKPA